MAHAHKKTLALKIHYKCILFPFRGKGGEEGKGGCRMKRSVMNMPTSASLSTKLGTAKRVGDRGSRNQNCKSKNTPTHHCHSQGRRRLKLALHHPARLFHVESQPFQRARFRNFAPNSLFGLVDLRLHLLAVESRPVGQ